MVMIGFRGITLYQGSPHKVIDAFNQHTNHCSKRDTVGAFYNGNTEAIVLDGKDFDEFRAITGADPHGKAHKLYHYYHPATYSHFSVEVRDYYDQHPDKDEDGQPINTLSV